MRAIRRGFPRVKTLDQEVPERFSKDALDFTNSTGIPLATLERGAGVGMNWLGRLP